MTKILLIEDDVNLAFMLADSLEDQGYVVIHEPNGDHIEVIYKKNLPDVVILDVDLRAESDGFEVAEKLRKISNVPIIFATAKVHSEDLSKGFNVDNTDYVKKPYSTAEIVLRMDRLLQQNAPKIEMESYCFGGLEFVPAEHVIRYSRVEIKLPKRESQVLEILCQRKNEVVPKDEITEYVWGKANVDLKDASLHNIISSLRTKLSETTNISILTIAKEGYKLIVQ